MHSIIHVTLTLLLSLAAPADPDPEMILRSAIERMQKVEAATGRIEVRHKWEQADEERAWSLDATVALQRLPDSELGWVMAYEATVDSDWEGQSGQFTTVYDGERLMVADNGRQTAFIVGPEQGAADFLARNQARHTAASWLREFSDGTFDVAFNPDVIRSLRYLGVREFDGVECDVVEYVGEMGGYRATGTWYIGREDGVVRRYHELSGALDGTRRGENDTRYLDVSVNPAPGAIPADAFVIALPEGFEQVAYVPSRPPSLRPGMAAPAFSAKDSEGQVRSLEEFAGKVVVLDFWATWCMPCRRAMPVMQAMHDQWRDQGLEVIGISTWEREGDPIGYFREQEFTYTCLVEGEEAAEAYRVRGLPTVVVIGRDGRILLVDSGWSESKERQLRAVVAEALNTQVE